jgi:hypothetical protein
MLEERATCRSKEAEQSEKGWDPAMKHTLSKKMESKKFKII